MTPMEEAQARAIWAARKKIKDRARISKMKSRLQERTDYTNIPASRRVWCMKTCKWIDGGQQ